MKYIDLFCGIGGFHQGIERIFPDSKCIFASDFDFPVSEVYKNTYGIDCYNNIKLEETHRKLEQKVVENGGGFDVLFAGFPCQSFSKAGNQLGFKDTNKGILFFQVADILEKYHPKFAILENVRNLVSHDKGKTWLRIKAELERIGYVVDKHMISPHYLGIPQLRERIFIVCIYDPNHKIDKINIKWPEKKNLNTYNFEGKSINEYLDKNVDAKYYIDNEKIKIINIWEELRVSIKCNGGNFISPIWLYYLNDKPIPKSYPEWKKKLIKKNKNFYFENREIIDAWKEKYDSLKFTARSNRKFEWNANTSIDSVWDGIIQFRPSGIRVKNNKCFPTFVAINQTPIIGKYKRYITPLEISRLYGFNNLILNKNDDQQSYKQLGNTVCVDIVAYVINEFINNYNDGGEV